MRTVFLLCILCLVGGCTEKEICITKRQTEQAREEIEKALIQWTESFNDGDLEGVMKIFAPNVLASYQGEPDKHFEELKQYFSRQLKSEDTKMHYNLEIDQIDVSGNLAISWLFWHLNEKDKNKISHKLIERGVDEWRLFPDGKWKIVRYAGFPMENTNPSGP